MMILLGRHIIQLRGRLSPPRAVHTMRRVRSQCLFVLGSKNSAIVTRVGMKGIGWEGLALKLVFLCAKYCAAGARFPKNYWSPRRGIIIFLTQTKPPESRK